MISRCQVCGGNHIHWWRKTLLWHIAMTVKLAVGIVRKPWWEKSDEPFANIQWSLAWEIARDINWKKERGQ